MIQIPENQLTKRLKTIQEQANQSDEDSVAKASRDHDLALAAAWKTLEGTPAKQALDVLLANMEGQIMNQLTEAHCSSEVRAFLAGKLRTIYELQAGIDRFINFEAPDVSEYRTEARFGDPDAVEGLGDDVSY